MNSLNNITPLEWDLIETYLLKTNEREKLLLKEQMVVIPNLDEKIKEVQSVGNQIEDRIKQSKIKEFQKEASILHKQSEVGNVGSSKTKSKTIWYSVAAILIVVIGMFWLLDSNDTSKIIFAENFKPDIGLPLQMGTTNNYEFYEGMVDYKQGNYKEATMAWQELLKKNPESDTLNYFLGVANLAQGNSSKSLLYLEKQGKFQESIFKDDAPYYAALAYIKLGNLNAAKVLLQNHPSERNTALLQTLKAL